MLGSQTLESTIDTLRKRTTHRASAVDARTPARPHSGHTVSQCKGKRIEEPFGWIKTITGGHKLRYIGQKKNRAWFLMTGAVYNLLRIAVLDAQAA